MDHKAVQGELQAYLDGALPPEAMSAVRAHLDDCAACRAELALLREVDEALRAWPVLPEPEGLAARVMAEIRAPTTAPKAAPVSPWKEPWPWLRAHWSEVLVGAAGVATLVVLIVSLRAFSVQGVAELGFWELQVERALAAVERMWYIVRADAWRVAGMGTRPGVGAGSSRPMQARYAAQFYCWVAGSIAATVALGAGVAGVRVLAQQWRRGMGVTT